MNYKILVPMPDPASVSDYRAAGGYEGLNKALPLSGRDAVEELKASVLAGRGGAGFPTGKKWEMVLGEESPLKYVVCNADEGEAGAFKDRVLLEKAPLRVIEGMTIAGCVLGAAKGYIYLRGEYRGLRPLVEKALQNAREAGLLGENILGRFSFDIELVTGAGAYLCGEETALLNSIEGLRGEPRNRPPYPTHAGLYGMPTLLNNAETFANVPLVYAQGAAEYNRHATKLVSLSGCVKNRAVFEVELGSVTLHQLIYGENYGGGTVSGKKAAFYQIGGQSAVVGFPEQIYTPFNYAEMASVGLGIGSGAILVADEEVSLPEYCRNVVEFFVHESCGKCIPCRGGLPQLLNVLDRMVRGEGKSGDVALLESLCAAISGLSACGLGQGACKAVQSALNYRRAAFLALEA